MIKKTLYFGNPAYLSLRNHQLVITIPSGEGKKNAPITRPIEDLGLVVIDNPQITITSGLLEALTENRTAVLTCNSRRMPHAMLLPMAGNDVQSERYRVQLEASVVLRKQLWQQTVSAKIANQCACLKMHTSAETGNMQKWAKSVRSGDPDNLEARAAVYYWKTLFQDRLPQFVRDQDDDLLPNSLLNYGYAILRSIVARSLVISGMLPSFGIHHHNRYNAYCLADDIMEPYRPYVDELVLGILDTLPVADTLTIEHKRALLTIPTIDTVINNLHRPLMVAVGQTTASLYRCFSKEQRRIAYPDMSQR